MRAARQAVVRARIQDAGSGDLEPRGTPRCRAVAGGFGVEAEGGRGREARREERREPDAGRAANSLHRPVHPNRKRAAQ